MPPVFGCGGGIFHCPVENIVVPGAESLRPRLSLFSPLSRSLLPPPAAVALQAHSLRQPGCARGSGRISEPKRKAPARGAFLFGCGGGIFHCPVENIVVPGAELLRPPALLIFSLVALPPPAPGGGRTRGPLPPATRMCAGFRSHFRAKEKSTRKGCFSLCIAPLKKISAENPYGIRDFGVFNAFFATSARFKQNHRNSSVSQKRYHSFFKAICEAPVLWWSES